MIPQPLQVNENPSQTLDEENPKFQVSPLQTVNAVPTTSEKSTPATTTNNVAHDHVGGITAEPPLAVAPEPLEQSPPTERNFNQILKYSRDYIDDQYESATLKNILEALDEIQLNVANVEVRLGDFLCILLSHPLIMISVLIWVGLSYYNSLSLGTVGIIYDSMRLWINFFIQFMLDTSAVIFILSIYSYISNQHFNIFVRAKVLQAYEEYLIVKQSRETTLGLIGKTISLWFHEAKHDIVQKSSEALKYDFETTNIGDKRDPSRHHVIHEDISGKNSSS